MSRWSIISEESSSNSSATNHKPSIPEFSRQCRRFSPPTSTATAAGDGDAQPIKKAATDGGAAANCLQNILATVDMAPPAVQQLSETLQQQQPQQQKMTERCVLVARQPDGYGLTVNGEYPVKVAAVKHNGAAHLAGVRAGDRILKVNGMPVTAQNFQEVIKMISGGYNLALTLLGPAAMAASSWDDFDKLFPVQHQQTPVVQCPQSPPAAMIITGGDNNNSGQKMEMLNDPNWRQRCANELFRALQRERTNLEANMHRSDKQQQQHIIGPAGGGIKLERALGRISQLERKLNALSPLLNNNNNGRIEHADNNNFNTYQQQQQQTRRRRRGTNAGKCGGGTEKRVSLCSAAESGVSEQQSNKTFPPSSMRVAPPKSAATAAVVAAKVEPIRSWVETGGMHYIHQQQQQQQQTTTPADLLLMGDELEEAQEEEDEGRNSDLGSNDDPVGPFSNLQELKSHPAALAIFLTHLMNTPNPGSLLFYLITDAFPSSSVKDQRRFAYEIFSTFLIPGAPLQLPNIAQRDIQIIDKVLRTICGSQQPPEGTDQLRKLFISTRTRAVSQINEQLADFRRRGQPFEPVDGVDSVLLDSLTSRADRGAELRLAGRLLFKTLQNLAKSSTTAPFAAIPDFENIERRTLALIMSIATLIKVVFCLRTSNSALEKLLDKCPTFLMPTSKHSGAGTSMFKMLASSAKQKFQLKDHQFLLQPVLLTVHCYQCREAVWGVNPQAYFCQNCDVVVHKNCTSQLTDHCWPTQQQKAKTGPQHHHHHYQRQPSASVSTLSLLNTVNAPLHPSSTTRLKHAGGATTAAGVHYKGVGESVSTYAQSLGGHDSVYSVSILNFPKQQRPKRSSPKSSLSLTPPLGRSVHSTALDMKAGSKEGSSIDKHGNDLIPPYEHEMMIDADHHHHPPQHHQQIIGTISPAKMHQPKMESLDSSSSPPSSTAMLPPPVFSTRFERIAPPDVPPSVALDSAATQPATKTHRTPIEAHAKVVQPITSMDSGICTQASSSSAPVVTTASTTTTPAAAAVAASAVPTRSQSIKKAEHVGGSGGGGSSLKRGPGGSLGAADSSGGIAQLAIPTAAALKACSAGDIAQSPHSCLAGTSSSSCVELNAEEEERRLVDLVERFDLDWGSDLEVDTEIPSLESLVSWEILKHLKPKEKKRQEVVNELYQTGYEKDTVLYKVFYRPMVLQRVASPHLVKLLFGNLDELLKLHAEMCQKMKRLRRPNGLYGDLGAPVEELFSGQCGAKFKATVALFCQNQQHALDALRHRYNRAKDDPFSQFLADAENNPLCRKLQLKDMIPVEMQRLVKYPLLLETVAKYTPDPSDELQKLLSGIQGAKNIVSEVNSAKRNADNVRRMEELQKKLDFSAVEKGGFFQKFDFRMHKLIYEGPLVWRQARGKTVDLHVVLLEHLLVFLTKAETGGSGGGGQPNLQLKIHEAGCIPIMRLASVEVEEKVGEKRAFNLLYKCDLRMFELVTQTATERKTWFRLIDNQASVSRLSPVPAELFLDGTLPTVWAHPTGAGRLTPLTTKSSEDGSLQQLSSSSLDQVHVLTHPSLVNANEIVIQQPTVMDNAQPVLSMAERLRKNDRMIFASLAEKHQILAELLNDRAAATAIEDDDDNNREKGGGGISALLDRMADQMTGLAVFDLKQRNAKELAMSAIVQGNRLLECINKGMVVKPSEDPNAKPLLDNEDELMLPSVPCYKLTSVAAPLMNHLKAMLQVLQDQEREIQTLKQRLKETQANPSRKTASEETLVESAPFPVVGHPPQATKAALSPGTPPPPPSSNPPAS
uniref:Guanine nucleotide exchange factor n=1 Tax=Globodera rostochiensis TaxID=31243 RepID=A0A914I5J6_GLORO